METRRLTFISLAQLGRELEGCLIADVWANSPAASAGLRATTMNSNGSIELGDLVTGVNGDRVRQGEDLISAIEERRDGDKVLLSVLRNCDPLKSETIEVTLTTRDKLKQETSTAPAPAFFGGTTNQRSAWQ